MKSVTTCCPWLRFPKDQPEGLNLSGTDRSNLNGWDSWILPSIEVGKMMSENTFVGIYPRFVFRSHFPTTLCLGESRELDQKGRDNLLSLTPFWDSACLGFEPMSKGHRFKPVSWVSRKWSQGQLVVPDFFSWKPNLRVWTYLFRDRFKPSTGGSRKWSQGDNLLSLTSFLESPTWGFEPMVQSPFQVGPISWILPSIG